MVNRARPGPGPLDGASGIGPKPPPLGATGARAAQQPPAPPSTARPRLAGIGVDLADARAAVRKGDLAPSQGQAIASLARAEIAIWEAGEAAARLAVLERLLAPGDSE